MKYFEQIKCRVCGEDLKEQESGIFKCNYCGAEYKRQDVEAYLKKIELSIKSGVTDALVKQRDCDIGTLRHNLNRELERKVIRKGRVIELCNGILELLGEDMQAECFKILSEAEPDPNEVIERLNRINVNSYELYLVKDILNYIFEHVYINKKYLAAISDLIHRAYEVGDERYQNFSEEFEKAVEKEKYDVYDTTKKRVAFIAHATEDRELAFKLVDKIEGRLLPDACFISERNLKHASASEYDTKMPEAIENCAIFVLVSSKYSRDRACGTRREMNVVISNDESAWRARPEYESKYDSYDKIPEKYKKHRLEWRLDPKGGDRTEGGNYAKLFFGTQDWLTDIDKVADKIIEMWNDILTAQPPIETQAAKKKICLNCGTETNLEDQYCPKCGGASFVATNKEYLKIKEERAEAAVREAKEESEKLKRENTKLNKQIEKSKVQRTKPVRQKVMSEGARMGLTIMKWVIGGLLFAIGVVLAVFGFISATVLYSDELRFTLFILICVGFVLHMAFMSLTFAAKSNSIFNEASAGRKFLSVLLYIFSILVGYVGCAVCVYTGIFGLIFAFLGGELLVLFLPVYDLSPSGAAVKTLNIVLVCLIILGWFLGVSSIMWRSYYTEVTNGEYFDFEYQISQTDPDEVVISGYNGDSTEIVIPTEIEGKAVSMIGPHAFEECINVESITIEANISEIGAYSFSGCTSLIEIVIPDSVTSIGEGAFYGCTSLYTVIIPDSITSVSQDVFTGCNNLTEVTMPAQFLSTVPKDNLKTVVITSGTAIADSEFAGCSSLESITIADSIESIGEGAFSGCSALQSMTLPFVGGNAAENSSSRSTLFGYIFGTDSYSGGVPALQYYYYDCYGYNDTASITYYIPALLTSVVINGGNILYCSFSNCSRIQSLVLEDIQSIGSYAFHNCSSLSNLTIPNNMISIGSYAFNNCSSLIDIAIPSSVEDIDNSAFNNCSSLSGVYITDATAWCAIDFENDLANPLYYAGNLYLNGELVSEFVIPNSVTEIGTYVFSGCTSLTSIVIPNSVTEIGAYAFSGCTSLTSIVIPDGVTEIGTYTFYDCTSLTSIVIPDGVTYIGRYAFSGCTSLTNVVFENKSGWVAYSRKSESYSSYTDISDNDLYNYATAARFLTTSFDDCFWLREGI